MTIEIETSTEQVKHGWKDKDGFVGPFKPGTGPRTDPRGEFPTGPSIKERMPDIIHRDIDGRIFDLHEIRGNAPTLFIFFRSAVW